MNLPSLVFSTIGWSSILCEDQDGYGDIMNWVMEI